MLMDVICALRIGHQEPGSHVGQQVMVVQCEGLNSVSLNPH